MPDNPPERERLIRLTPDLVIKPFDGKDTDLNDLLFNTSKISLKAFSRNLDS